MSATKVVITNGCADLGVVVSRSLAAAGFTVYATDTRAVPRWAMPRSQRQLVCIDAADPGERQEQILRFIACTGAELFLPLCSQGVRLAVERHGELSTLCHSLVPDQAAFAAAYDKRRCMEALDALAVPCAGSLSPSQADELLRSRAGQRVVVKPVLDAGAAQGLRLVERPCDLEAAITACTASYGACLIQEFIPGSPEAMHSLTVVFDRHTQLVGAFALQKRRQVPVTGGNTALARSLHDAALLGSVLPFFQKWRWRGPAEVEAKWDARRGQMRVIEINPRFPGTLRLAVLSGLDLPRLVARAAAGEELQGLRGLSPYREGVVYLAPTLFARTVNADAARRGWRAALASACRDAAGSGPCLAGLLAEPLPLLARSLLPARPLQPQAVDCDRSWST